MADSDLNSQCVKLELDGEVISASERNEVCDSEVCEGKEACTVADDVSLVGNSERKLGSTQDVVAATRSSMDEMFDKLIRQVKACQLETERRKERPEEPT